ncbi:hypothetical protein, partial [Treponema socranskii]|uniref:hypothetical protein n=1 Tax=Treponema socranskii TaxID=53419 RepID=UPI0028E76E9E
NGSAVFQLSTYQSDFEQWPFAIHPCIAHYRIFALRKNTQPFCEGNDTASLPCAERRSPHHLQRARSAKFPALKSAPTGRCGVSPLEGAARNEVRARGRLSPLLNFGVYSKS